jgi:hypothetical protein
MNTEIKGKVIVLRDTVQVTDSFKKREVVVETVGEYPQQIPIEFKQAKTELLNDINVGDEVTVSVNILGREYNGKYYAGIEGWKIVATPAF